MDPLSLGFIALLVVLSGAIAYWGDVIGRKLGKKRLTIGKLRPRHTAALMTALFGAMATLLTVLALIALFEPARVWLVEGRKVQDRLATVQARLDKSEETLQTADEAIDKTQSQLNDQKRLLAEETQKVKTASQQVDDLRQQSARLRRELAQFRERLARAGRDLRELQTVYRQLQTDADSLKVNNSEFQRQNQQLNARNLDLTNQNRELEVELARLEADVTSLRESLRTLNETLQRSLDESKQQLDAIRAERDRVKADLDAAQAELETSRQRLDTLRLALQESQFASRTQPLIYNTGDEVARLAVGPGLNRAEARTYLLALIESASSLASVRGAAPPPGGGDSVNFRPAVDANGRPISAAEQFEAALGAVTGRRDPLLLVARSAFNAFRGEPVVMEFRFAANNVVYRAGELVGEVRVDGSRTEEQILRELGAYINDTLVPTAIGRGMVPAIGQEQPLGEIPREILLRLIQELIELDRPVRVQFVAMGDTRAGDALRLDYRLR